MLTIAVAVVFLVRLLGTAAVVGLGALLALIPPASAVSRATKVRVRPLVELPNFSELLGVPPARLLPPS